MKRKLMASVLLAGMAFVMPVYADDDRTQDEYNSNAKYESPLAQQRPVIVNDRLVHTSEESDRFAEAAGRIAQGAASGKDTTERKEAVKAAAVSQAERKAEAELRNTDDNFEPAVEQVIPGHEYQARHQNTVEDSGINTIPELQPEKNILNNITQTNTQQGIEKYQNIEKQKKNTPQPLIITGDDAHYANDSGDFVIEGNVKLEQGITRLSSAKAVGNAKTGDVWLLTGGTMEEPSNTVQVKWAHYNFNNKTGELRQIEGAALPDLTSTKKDLYRAPHAIVEDGKMIIDQGGEYTRCPAVLHTPCVSVKAKTITIIPNDKIVARDVKVYARGKYIYSRAVWQQSLVKREGSAGPRFGWNSDKGFNVALDYEQPIGNPLAKNPTKAYMTQAFYTKSKYKPFYGIRHDEHDFYVRLHDGYVYDSDNDLINDGIWLHKKTDWGLFLKPHRFAKGIPLTYDASVTHGLWKYNHESWSSWHTETTVNLRHDRIHLFGGKKLYLDLMIGRKWVNESLDNAVTRTHGKNLNTNIYHGTIGYRFSDKWNIWGTYHNEHKTSYLFSLGQPDFSKEWITGIAWTPDKRNSVVIVNRYNADNSSWSHGNYSTVISWSHRFCCEGFTVSYERKHYNHENNWTVRFNLVNW